MGNSTLFKELYRERPDLSLEVFREICISLDTPVSLSCYLLLKYGERKQLLMKTLSPLSYNDPEQFRDDYLIVSLLQKSQSISLGNDLELESFDSYLKQESVNALTEERLKILKAIRGITSVTWNSVIFTASKKIQDLLGPFSWSECYQFMRSGPGATTRTSHARADLYYKRGLTAHVTKDAFSIGKAYAQSDPRWFNLLGSDGIIPVDGSKTTTVPKSWKARRVIAIEPCLNIELQMGIGSVIRRRLLRAGVDLRDQSQNQRLARIGSIHNTLATIDLSNASDSVTLELVRQLLPADWCDALEQVRSPVTSFRGRTIRLHKVSSMGNGFTFDLETLIFWSLYQAVRSLFPTKCLNQSASFYGDDLVVPVELVGPYMEVLKIAGFIVNKDKSFIDGPFRESCGKHYFRGVDVTPLYFREKIDSIPRYIWLANSIRRYANTEYSIDSRFSIPYWYVRKRITGTFSVPRIPDGYGDGALIGCFDEVLPHRAPFGKEGWVSIHFDESYPSFVTNDESTLIKALTLIGSSWTPCLAPTVHDLRFTWNSQFRALRHSFPSELVLARKRKRYKVSKKTLYVQWSAPLPFEKV